MSNPELKQAVLDTMYALKDEGINEVFVSDLGQEIAKRNERFLSLGSRFRRQIGFLGIKQTRNPSLLAVAPYSELQQLEEEGEITSYFEDIDPAIEGRPRRRAYALVDSGGV